MVFFLPVPLFPCSVPAGSSFILHPSSFLSVRTEKSLPAPPAPRKNRPGQETGRRAARVQEPRPSRRPAREGLARPDDPGRKGRPDDVRLGSEKAQKLVDAAGNFDPAKAAQAFKNGHGIGQVGRPSDRRRTRRALPWMGGTAKQMAELTNAMQKFFIEHSRLGIPVIFHEECLHGHAARDGTSFFAADRAGRDLQSRAGRGAVHHGGL